MTIEALSQSLNESLHYGHPLEVVYLLAAGATDPRAVLETAPLADGLGYELLGAQDRPYQLRHLDAQSLPPEHGE